VPGARWAEGASRVPFRIPRAKEQSPLTAGERLCDLGWLDDAGDRVSLYEDARSGRVTLLLVFSADTAPGLDGAAIRLAELAARFEALQVQVLAVTAAGPETASRLALPCPLLRDRDFAIGAALERPAGSGDFGCLLLFDPNLRLDCLIDLAVEDPVGQALRYCEERARRLSPQLVETQPPVLVLPNLLSEAECQRLIDYWHRGERYAGGVANDATGGNVPLHEIKVREDVAIPDQCPQGKALLALFRGRLFPEIEKAFGFPASRAETLRLGCYDAEAGGHFLAHRDDTSAFTAHRRFAMSLFLNSGEYEGGHLIFPEYGPQRYNPPRGSAVVFSCALLHQVTPVTAGRRFGLFGFFHGEAEEAVRQRQKAERLKPLVTMTPTSRSNGWPGA